MTPDQTVGLLLIAASIIALAVAVIRNATRRTADDMDAQDTARTLAWLDSLRNTDVPTLHNAEAVALGNDSGLRVPSQREAS